MSSNWISVKLQLFRSLSRQKQVKYFIEYKKKYTFLNLLFLRWLNCATKISSFAWIQYFYGWHFPDKFLSEIIFFDINFFSFWCRFVLFSLPLHTSLLTWKWRHVTIQPTFYFLNYKKEISKSYEKEHLSWIEQKIAFP